MKNGTEPSFPREILVGLKILGLGSAYPSVGTGPEKKAKIFLQDYQGDFYNLYVTFDGGSDFRSFEPVSCIGIQKTGILYEKIMFFVN